MKVQGLFLDKIAINVIFESNHELLRKNNNHN